MILEMLPVGTIVQVVEQGEHARRPYIGKIVGYDVFHSKYHIGARFMGWDTWLWQDGGSWAFPGNVEALDEDDIPRLAGLCDHDGVTIIYDENQRVWKHTGDTSPFGAKARKRTSEEHEPEPLPGTVALASVWDYDEACARKYASEAEKILYSIGA